MNKYKGFNAPVCVWLSSVSLCEMSFWNKGTFKSCPDLLNTPVYHDALKIHRHLISMLLPSSLSHPQLCLVFQLPHLCVRPRCHQYLHLNVVPVLLLPVDTPTLCNWQIRAGLEPLINQRLHYGGWRPLTMQPHWFSRWSDCGRNQGKITLGAVVYIGFTAGISMLLQPHARQWVSVWSTFCPVPVLLAAAENITVSHSITSTIFFVLMYNARVEQGGGRDKL